MYFGLLVPVAGVCAVLAAVFAVRVNRQKSVGQTIMCVFFPVLFADFAVTKWYEWHAASGNEAFQYSVAFAIYCVTFVITMIALIRRLLWLRHHHHEGWTG